MKTSTPKGNHPSRPARKACSRPVKPTLLGVCLLSALFSTASAQLFTDVPGLSQAGRDALVTHFDARVGVSVNGTGGVTAWEGRDGDGNRINVGTVDEPQWFTANRSGNAEDDSDKNKNITRNASNSALVFTEDNITETAHLYTEMDDLLSGGAVTIFWKGFYSGSDPQGDGELGRYAYNLSAGEINTLSGGMNHQRRNEDGNVGAFFTGGNGTVLGDSISARNDVSTIYRSEYDLGATTPTADFFADGTDLDMGAPGGGTVFGTSAQPNLYIGAFSFPTSTSSSNGGWSFIGDMEQLIIFEGTLGPSDIAAVESYLTAIPEPSTYALLLTFGAAAYLVLRPRLRRGR